VLSSFAWRHLALALLTAQKALGPIEINGIYRRGRRPGDTLCHSLFRKDIAAYLAPEAPF
jgi:hypothetical protein